MNILFVADVSIQKVIGGAERVLFEQSTRLASMGHAVTILTRRMPAHTSEHEIIHGVHEWRYSVDTSNSLTFFQSSLNQCRKLFQKISQDISFDVINFHQPFSAYAVNTLKTSGGIKKIYTCHSLAFEEYQKRLTDRSLLKQPAAFLHTTIRKFIEKFSLNQSQKIIVLSQFTRDKLITTHGIPEHKIDIIPGAADIDYFHPAPDKTVLRREFQLPDNKLILFTVRNLVPRMGLENLVKAASFLYQKGIPFQLIIGGDGILKENLQSLVNTLKLDHSVKLSGFLSKDQLLKHYQTADFFILPTIALEGFGLVTVEAMACGTPVLGTPIGGTKEILSAFDSSFLFKDLSPESIAACILEKYRHFQNQPDAYKILRQKCREFAEEHYSWQMNVQQTERLFHSCAASAAN